MPTGHNRKKPARRSQALEPKSERHRQATDNNPTLTFQQKHPIYFKNKAITPVIPNH